MKIHENEPFWIPFDHFGDNFGDHLETVLEMVLGLDALLAGGVPGGSPGLGVARRASRLKPGLKLDTFFMISWGR